MTQANLKRIYNTKDVVMLTTLSVILKNAEDYLAELTEENENWNATLISTLKARVNKAFTDILGIDPKKDQREATAIIKALQADAIPLISTITLRLRVAIKNIERRTEVLTQLGFSAFSKAAKAKDHMALIELLTQLKTNLTPALQAEITASKDIKSAMLDSLIRYANTLHEHNINQESYKVASKNVTAENIVELNEVYTAVVTEFSVLVKDFYRKQKSAKKELFNFSSISKKV